MSIFSKEIGENKFLPWLVVLSASLLFFYYFIQMNMLNTIGEYLIKEFSLNSEQASQIFAILTNGNVLFLLPAGILLDRFSSKKLLVIAFFMAVIASYLFAVTNSFGTMKICRFIIGAAAAFSFLAPVKIASRWFRPKQMALVVGMVVTMAMLGGIVAQTPLSMLVNKFGWRTALKLFSLLGLIMVLVQTVVVNDAPKGFSCDNPKAGEDRNLSDFFKSLGRVVANSQNWLAGLYISLANLPVFILGGAWGVQYLVQARSFERIDASNVVSMIFLGMIFGSPAAGWISDKLGARKLPMIIGAILLVLVVLAAMFAPNLSLGASIVLYLLIGFASSVQVIGYPLIAESNPVATLATANSIASILIVSAGVLVPVYGWILDKVDAVTGVNSHIHSVAAFGCANYLMLVSAILAFIIALLVKETNCKSIV